jgi:protein TonB
MHQGLKQPDLLPEDRLSLTFCLAAIFHALVILGIVFAPEEKAGPRYEYMDIVLVRQSSEAPEDADVLAQANLRGGGEIATESIPAAPLPPLPKAEQTEPAEPAAPQEIEPVAEPELPEPASPPEQETVEQLAVEVEKTTSAVEQTPDAVQTTRPSASELMTNSLKMAALSSEVQRKLETRAKRPKRTFISASTRQYKYAAYMEAWRAKVERVGNLNYPEEARRRKISGQLVLDVALNPDGKINQITIRSSSGHKVLDDAAIRIVELAAPYAPFPDAIRAETDVLHITRTWQFLDQSGFK